MGMPGIVVLMISKPIINLLYGPMAFEAFESSLGDEAWPLLLMLSILWPISIPIAYGLCQKLFGSLPFFSIGNLIPFLIFVLIGTAIISTLTVSMNKSLHRLSDSEILEQALRIGKLSLVKKYWNVEDNAGYDFGDPLYVALDNKQKEVAHSLLDNGVNPQQYTKEHYKYDPGLTPLHTATKNGMNETMKKLLSLGVDPDIRSGNGKTPLHTLGDMEQDKLEAIEILKFHKADFTAVDNDGNTPLMTLAMINAPLLKYRPMLARKLVDYGCPLAAKNNKGQTALDIMKEDQLYEHQLRAILSGE